MRRQRPSSDDQAPASAIGWLHKLAAEPEVRVERAFDLWPWTGAGERIRTADLPFTRRLLCQLSYTGGDLEHGSRSRS
jgi:hypothetical protein